MPKRADADVEFGRVVVPILMSSVLARAKWRSVVAVLALLPADESSAAAAGLSGHDERGRGIERLMRAMPR